MRDFYEYDSRLLPQVRLFDTAVIQPPYVHKRRMPKEFIIYIIRRGEMYLSEGENFYHLIPGDFLLLDPEEIHVGKKATHCEYYYIHYDYPRMKPHNLSEQEMRQKMLEIRGISLKSNSCESAEMMDSTLFLPKYYHLASDASYYGIMQKIGEAAAYHGNHLEGYKTLCSLKILEILILISRQYLKNEIRKQDGNTRSYKKIYDVLDYLNTCYGDSISSDVIEARFQCNFDYLNRMFRNNVGKTIFQYLSEIRIDHAKELITTTSMQIRQISEQVGFNDESYFSKVFKRYTGVAPMIYAKKAMND